jgi:hypothetical protein
MANIVLDTKLHLVLIVIDPPRNAIEIIFGKSNDYCSAMRLPKYFFEACGFHLGFDESYRLIGICLPRHQIRLSLLEELSQLEGEEASWNNSIVEAKIKEETKVTMGEGELIIRFTDQSDRACPLTNRTSKFPIFAILTEEKASIPALTAREEPMLNGFIIPLDILPEEWLEEIDVYSGGDCLKDPNSDFVGCPALPEQKSNEFFVAKNPPPTWTYETTFKPTELKPEKPRPPPSRAFQQPRSPTLVVSPRIEVLAKALDGSGVDVEVSIFHGNDKRVEVDRGRTKSGLGGWWRSKTLTSGRYNVVTFLQTDEATYFDSNVVVLKSDDVCIESGPVWKRQDNNQWEVISLLRNSKRQKQKLETQILENGTIIRVLSAG